MRYQKQGTKAFYRFGKTGLGQIIGGNMWLVHAPKNGNPRQRTQHRQQPKARPPYFALFGNQLNALPDSYRRYLVNGIREAFDLPGTPIRLSFRTSENPYGKKGK